jgi:excisionase family DNA binding protein
MTAERFLTLADVAEILNISASQTYALVRSGDLQGIQIGGRNQWRVERSKLEEYIEAAYKRTTANLSEMPATMPSET